LLRREANDPTDYRSFC